MDFIISFFRDTLDGGLYYIVVAICLILIMAIIGFIMEKAKLAKEESEKTVVIADSNGAPVNNQEVVVNTNANAATNITGSVVITDDASVNRPTEEANFIDFGSTTDSSSNIAPVANSQNSTEQLNIDASQGGSVVINTVPSVQAVDNPVPQIVTNTTSNLEAASSNTVSNSTLSEQQVVPEIIDIN